MHTRVVFDSVSPALPASVYYYELVLCILAICIVDQLFS